MSGPARATIQLRTTEENMCQGRVAFVTDGTRGIGAAISKRLKDKG